MKEDLFDYAQYLLKLAVKKTDNFEQAEDLVSETLLSAIVAKQGGLSEKIENLQAYLTGILNHKFNDFLRSKYSKPVISYGVISRFDFESSEESALDKLIKNEEREKVRSFIAQLSKNYREVLVRHFIHGQGLQAIAEELDINTNTVKSRLNTARMNLKSQMEKKEMEKFEKQSYEPEQLEIWMYGEMENDCQAFYVNNWTRRIHQNILIMAYKKPLTITELSQGLGISAAYIEPIVEELISYDFMARKGDKVYTSFIIFTQEEKDRAYDHDKALAEKHAQKMWELLETWLEKIRQLDCYKKMNERQKASLLQFAAIFIIHEAVREVKAQKIPKPDVMSIKHEAKWQGYAYGFQTSLDYKDDWDYVTGHSLCKLNGCHALATGPYKNHEDMCFYAYDVAAGFTFSKFWPLDHLQFLKVCYALYAGEESDIPLIAPKFFDKEVIERYEECNLLGKEMVAGNAAKAEAEAEAAFEEGGLTTRNAASSGKDLATAEETATVLNLPVLETDDAEYLFDNIFHFAIMDFAKSFHAELESLLVNPVEPPKHLRDQVPETLKYQLCGDAFVMALVYQGAWNGWYKNEYAGRNEKVPAMVICVGKQV